MDKATILSDATRHVKELQEKIKALEADTGRHSRSIETVVLVKKPRHADAAVSAVLGERRDGEDPLRRRQGGGGEGAVGGGGRAQPHRHPRQCHAVHGLHCHHNHHGQGKFSLIVISVQYIEFSDSH
jgi:hypothetical protein